MPTAETVACPYCNAFVPVPPGTPAGRRIACPRCDEAFAYLPRDAVNGLSAAGSPATPSTNSITTEAAAPAPATDTLRAKIQLLLRVLLAIAAVLLLVGGAYINSFVSNGLPVDFNTFTGMALTLLMLLLALGSVAFLWLWFFRVRRSNGATSLFVLANMMSLALVALGGALATQGYRRHNDAGLPARPKRSPFPAVEELNPPGPVAVAPARLAALGYLPPKTDLVAGVHVAELMDDPAGRKLIEEPLKLGGREVRLAELPAKLGLDVQELDHFVLGMHLDEPLSVVLVARTRQSYDALKVRQALNARSLPGTPNGRTLYQVTLPLGNLSALLWCADSNTFLVALARESLEKATVPGQGSPDPLTPEVREVLSQRVGPAGQLWAAGHSANWTRSAGTLLLSGLPGEWQQRLVTVHTFGIWAVATDKSVTLNAAARCGDARAAEALEKWLATRTAGKDAPNLARDGEWLSVQVRTGSDGFPSLLAP
jgi:hypothetical protein